MEVVGRHALLFDDDASANFVNSKEALVEWNSLFIDRYDVRHLLSTLPVSFKRLRHSSGSNPDSNLESELDVERYADLPSQSSYEQGLPETDEGTTTAGGFHAVAFSYGGTDSMNETNNVDRDSDVGGFCPPFSLPENSVKSLPSTEKEHQIIARTALFVSQHGGQSEIVLRVKQGDNPTFGFLMPHHHLHSYFRYLVDHPELLNSSNDGKSQRENKSYNEDRGPSSGGALSLLGSVYGSVEDEDPESEDAKVSKVSKETVSEETTNPGDPSKALLVEKQDNAPLKDERSNDVPHPKEKASTFGKSGGTIKSKSVRGKKEDALGLSGTAPNNSQLPVRTSIPNGEYLVIEPPSELKRLIDRIIEIILKNGQGFEALLIEQDKTHGRFPFLLSTNQYHPYYRKFLKMAQESRVVAASFGSSKDCSLKQGEESAAQDLPFDSDRKEKFKMVIGRTKRDVHEQPSREPQPQPVGISADAAAAILQAATRGIKNPNLDIFSTNHGSGSDGGGASSLGSLHSSQPQGSLQRKNGVDHPSMRVPVAKEIAKTAAAAAAGEADSSEACLTKEQKLKAERLKRAKMFAAMIKSGAPKPLPKDPPRGLSTEPPGSGLSGPVLEVKTQGNKEREGSSAPADIETHRTKEPERHSDDEIDEKTAAKKRHYRSRKHEDKESDGEHERHSRKKHRSHRSSRHRSDRSKDSHRRRHSSSKDKESRHSRHVRDSDSEDDDRHHHHRKHKRNCSSEDEYESRKHKRERKQKKKLSSGEADLEEGEIIGKSSDQSPSSVVDTANRENSVDRSNTDREERAPSQSADVPEDLRAKIRAMLLATM